VLIKFVPLHNTDPSVPTCRHFKNLQSRCFGA